jgi:PIN domain
LKSLLLIDANQYLSLFGIRDGKKLLDLLDKQKNCVFVTEQIADEVLRNKLALAERFFSQIINKDLAEIKTTVPNHLLGIDGVRLTALRKKFEDAKTAISKIDNFAIDVLLRISQSTDDVSRRLAPLLDRAVKPDEGELKRARLRREFGNPPGKPQNPLGDQISWEQFLTQCRKAKPEGVWIITRDKDFHTKFRKSIYLNPFLNRDLAKACGFEPQVYCFDDLTEGLTNFGRQIGEKDEALPTPQEAAKNKEDVNTWIANTSFDDSAATISAPLLRAGIIPSSVRCAPM